MEPKVLMRISKKKIYFRLNIDKLIFVQFPLHYYSVVNRMRLLILSLFTWITITSLSTLGYYFMEYVSEPVGFSRYKYL